MAGLFSYTENRVNSILEEAGHGQTSIREAVLDLLREEELLQELKSQNTELIEFLSDHVDIVLDYLEIQTTEEEVRQTALEVLCGFDEDVLSTEVAEHSAKILDKFLKAKEARQQQKWEQLILSLAHRHRYTLSRCVTKDMYNAMIENLDYSAVFQVFSVLFVKKPLLLDHKITQFQFLDKLNADNEAADNTARLALQGLANGSITGVLAGSIIASAATSALQQDFSVYDTFTLPLAEQRLSAKLQVLIEAVQKELLTEHDIKEALLYACEYMKKKSSCTEKLGLGRLAVARLARACLFDAYSSVFVASNLLPYLLDIFFSFAQHSLLHRTMIDLLIHLFETLPHIHTLASHLLLGDLDLTGRLIRAYYAHPYTSLYAHLITLAEALALSLCNAYIQASDGHIFASFRRDCPQRYKAFLDFISDEIVSHTLRRTTPSQLQQDSIFSPTATATGTGGALLPVSFPSIEHLESNFVSRRLPHVAGDILGPAVEVYSS